MKKIKYILPICLLCIANAIFSQVGVNTQKGIGGVFHIDAANNDDASPTAAQMADDVFVNTLGQLGVGTVAPTKKLHIQTTSAAPALRIADGSEMAGKVLTSDASGYSRWQALGAIPIIQIPLGSRTLFTINDVLSKYIYTGVPVTLPPGLWLIEVNMLIFKTSGTAASNFAAKGWIKTLIADTPTGQIHTNDSYGPGSTGRLACDFVYFKNNGFNMINGFFIINNKSGAEKTYYYMVGNMYSVAGIANTTSLSFGGQDTESSLFATYIDVAQP